MKNSLFVIIVLVFAVGGCKMVDSLIKTGSNTSTSNTAPDSNKTSAPKAGSFTPSGNPRDDVTNVSNNFLAEKDFQAVMDGTGGSGIHMEVQYIAPDRFHIMNSGMESILIGKDTYVKTGGTWRKMGMDLSSSIANMRDSFTAEELKGMTDVEYVGEDTVNGKNTYVYSFKGTRKDAGSYTQKLWVGKDDSLPLKIHIDYAGGTLKEITNVYTYDPGVTIEVPK